MKRFKILLAAAAMIAVGSSFTSMKDSEDQVYIDVDGQPTPIEQVTEEMGSCLPSGSFCTYRLEDDGVTKIPNDSNLHWQDAPQN